VVTPKPRKKKEKVVEATPVVVPDDLPGPLDIMLKAMHDSYDIARRAAKMRDMLSEFLDPSNAGDRQQLITLNEAASIAMKQALAAAEKAAPYVHPRLAATTMKGDEEAPLSIELFSSDELRAAIRGARD
jgi:hypothetical protein